MDLALNEHDSRQRPGHPLLGMIARGARSLLLALVGGCLLALFSIGLQIPQHNAIPSARACGLGSLQTMLANRIGALLYPLSATEPANAPQGVFPLNYTTDTPIAFTEDLSRVAGNPSLSGFQWRWNFGDGSAYVFAAQPTHTFARTGIYEVIVSIWDSYSNSWTSFDSAEIHLASGIVSHPPVAKATADRVATAIGQAVTFDATGSYATDGSPLTYLWNFNDGTTATGLQVTHTFVTNGTTTVALVVTDGRGAQSLTTIPMTILVQGPKAVFGASTQNVHPGTTISFNAARSSPPAGVPGDAITKYVWNFGDGTPLVTLTTPMASHTYRQEGSYQVTLTVFDKPEAQASATLRVNVEAVARGGANPLAIIGGLLLLAGLGVGGYTAWKRYRRAELVRRHQAEQVVARAHKAQRPQQTSRREGRTESTTPGRTARGKRQ